MCISHSVMEGHWASNIITPLIRIVFVYNGSKGMELAPTHVIVEVAKALRGSFKLVTLAPRTVRTD